MSKKCTDHLGNEFDSTKKMCDYWNILCDIYMKRINKLGWSIEEALSKPIREKNKQCIDHLGNKFDSTKKMCEHWNISYYKYKERINKSGWSIEEALTKPIKEKNKQCIDHLGNKFDSTKKMCEHWNISYYKYKQRINKLGWSIEEALTKPIREKNKQCIDHLGNKFDSTKKMCEHWNISYYKYKQRINKLGWSIEEALTKPIREKNKQCIDHLGNKFDSTKKMCKYYNIPYKIYIQRTTEYNWSIEEALTKSIKEKNKQCIDHLGNEFKSIEDMCKYWKISRCILKKRISLGWSLEEVLTIPINMYIGEYRVKQALEKYNISYIHNKTIKTIFKKFRFNIDWNDFLFQLQSNLATNNINWSKSKIEKLRPDFVLYRDKDNKITGVIEFDGEQHQNFIEYFFKTIEEFLRRSDVDFVKNSLWEYLNIPMLRIRYDQIDLIDNMVLDFINNPQNYISRHNTYLTEEEYWEGLKETLRDINGDDLGYAI